MENKTSNRSDKDLILQYQNGNGDAFETIYNRYGGRLYTFLLHQVGNSNADDLFQDIMIKVQKHLLKFNTDGSLKAWLTKIAINRIRDHQRKENRMKKIFIHKTKQNPDIEDKNDSSGSESDDNADVTLEFINGEISKILNAAIKQLPENQREVVNLHYLMDLTFKEISQVLDCSINTISARARYALKNIKKILGTKLVNELK